MNIYKVIFAKNEVIACELMLAPKIEFKGEYYYEHEKEHLIFAMIKAESISEAISKCDSIIKEVTNKVLGKDYVN